MISDDGIPDFVVGNNFQWINFGTGLFLGLTLGIFMTISIITIIKLLSHKNDDDSDKD